MDFGSCWGQVRVCLLLFSGCRSGACLEAEAVVSGLQDVAAVGEAVEQGRGHLGVTKDGGPFTEAQVGGDDDAGAFVKFAEQMEQQGPARGAERQVSQFVQDHEVELGQAFGDLSGLALGLFLFEGVDQFDGREEADLSAVIEPPRVYRRVVCSMTRRLYRVSSGLHRTPPLLLREGCIRWCRGDGGCYTSPPISAFPTRLRASISKGRFG